MHDWHPLLHVAIHQPCHVTEERALRYGHSDKRLEHARGSNGATSPGMHLTDIPTVSTYFSSHLALKK